MARKTEVLAAMDARIAEVEKELEGLQRAAERVQAVAGNLQTLRAARALMAGQSPNGEGTVTHQVRLGDTGRMKASARPSVVPGSILALAMEALSEAGHALNSRALAERVRAKGKEADLPTVVGALARAVKEGKLRRPAPSMYALP